MSSSRNSDSERLLHLIQRGNPDDLPEIAELLGQVDPCAPPETPHTRPAIQTLERLHAELGGQIQENKKEADRLADAMMHVEAVLKMLDPSYSLRRISIKRRKTNQWFKRGTLYRRALDVLRTALAPMTATEIAKAVLAAGNVTEATSKEATVLGQSIQASLRNHAGDGVEQVGDGIPAKWRLMG